MNSYPQPFVPRTGVFPPGMELDLDSKVAFLRKKKSPMGHNEKALNRLLQEGEDPYFRETLINKKVKPFKYDKTWSAYGARIIVQNF